MDDKTLEFYQKYYFPNAKPIPFKVKNNNYTLFIKPIMVEDISFYFDNVGILHIDKNSVNDAKIISMSYLQFLVEILLQQNEEYQRALTKILNLSLGEEYSFTIGHFENGKVFLGIQDENKEEICKINAKEFDKIKEIILCYNDKDYDGRYISEDMRKAMEDYYSIKFRNNYSHIPTLEERKLFVSFKSGLTLSQINEMSYRHFDIMYNQCVANDLFFSQKIIQASEKYKVNEDEIVYPLFKKNDKFSFLQNADNFEKKVSAAAKGGY